jgi:hypothetical protein
MKALLPLLLGALLAALGLGCDLQSSDTGSSLTGAAQREANTTSVQTTTPTAERSATRVEEADDADEAVADTDDEAPVTSNPSSLFSTTPTSLTLRSDFAATVRRVDFVYNNNEPNTNPGFVTPSRSGNTWTIPNSVTSYKRGHIPNTWRILLGSKPPAGVTYHTSIMQTFIRVGDNPYGAGSKTFPPTTRH